MRRLLTAILLVPLLACGDTSGPEQDHVGTYKLALFAYQPLPAVIGELPSYRLEITGGSLTLSRDDQWVSRDSLRSTVGDSIVVLEEDVEAGRYIMVGDELTFLQGERVVATGRYTGDRVSFILVGGTEYLYQR